MSGLKLVAAMVIMSVVTYLIRLLPLTFFRKKIKNPYIKSFLNFVPFAVLGAMTFPDVFSATGGAASAISGVVVAFVLSYMGKGLLTVSLVSCAVVYMVNLL
ncbi:MAG: AzlD domain-containing protein [Clostridia bacterium]|nr:AzlD domain-containing protein [Clostridia bacterium]